MSIEVKGKTRGLRRAQLDRIAKLAEKRVPRAQIVELNLAKRLQDFSNEIRSQIGILIARDGSIESIFLGSKDRLYLPSLGRARFGKARLRGLRLIYCVPQSNGIQTLPGDILVDLQKLRLDLVGCVSTTNGRVSLNYAHLLPSSKAFGDLNYQKESIEDLAAFIARHEYSFVDFIEELESEIESSTSRTIAVGPDPAVLVGVYSVSRSRAEASMNELMELAKSAGITVVDTIMQYRRADPRTILGKGKLEELLLHCLGLGVEVIVFDRELSPSQWRSLTNLTELKVLDRSMVILDIFAQRASSADGRLQVELAQLKYNLPRLTEKDAGLSRLTGGIGGRGPGETKLEVSRRRARDKIALLEKRIEKLSSQRNLRRKRAKELPSYAVALIGYTNVGKSTLFNQLSSSKVLAEDKLFATLDPTHRKLSGDQGQIKVDSRTVILTDTVGFIRDLPKELISAFRATLEVLYQAHLLVHVIDASDPQVEQRIKSVDLVLEEMGVRDLPQIQVINKTDLATKEQLEGSSKPTT